MKERLLNKLKTLKQKDKLLMMSNLSFCHNVFKSFLLRRRQKVSLWWKSLNHYLDAKPYVVGTENYCLTKTIVLNTHSTSFEDHYFRTGAPYLEIWNVISWPQVTFSWSLGKQTSTRLGNVLCRRAFLHDWELNTGFPNANPWG